MIASFPWYDLPAVQWANDVIWRATGFPGELERETPLQDQWRADDLFVSQACGLDLYLSGAPIQPVLAPVFRLDCEPGCYYSYLVGSHGGRVAAVNSTSSRSGWLALLQMCEPASFVIGEVVVTGSHTASLEAIRSGEADIASVDAVTWHILERNDPVKIEGIKILDRSTAAPAPPYIVSQAELSAEIADGLERALENQCTRSAREALFLERVIPVSQDDYLPVRREYFALQQRADSIQVI